MFCCVTNISNLFQETNDGKHWISYGHKRWRNFSHNWHPHCTFTLTLSLHETIAVIVILNISLLSLVTTQSLLLLMIRTFFPQLGVSPKYGFSYFEENLLKVKSIDMVRIETTYGSNWRIVSSRDKICSPT